MLTLNFKEAVVEALQEQLQHTSQNKLASQISVKEGGMSSALLSNMLNGKHDLISDDMWLKAANFLGLTKNSWPTIDTRNRQAVFKLCQDTIEFKNMAALAAITGYGKTHALQEFNRKNPEDTYYVHFINRMTENECLELIAKTMHIKERGTPAKMIGLIANKLKTKKLLILDNTDKVISQLYSALQALYDQSEFMVGILIAGTPYLKLQVDKMTAKNRKSWPELSRRISYWQPLYKPTADAVAGMAAANGITDSRAVQFLVERADNFGTVRNYIINAKRTGKPITRELLASLHIGSDSYNEYK